jgi:hypothetical protein
MTKLQMDAILLDVSRLEDCILEGVPPHSGYRKMAIKLVRRIDTVLKSHAKDLVEHETEHAKHQTRP